MRHMNSSNIQELESLLIGSLSTAQLRCPLSDEREPQFTARVIAPALDACLRQTKIHGLTLSGDGAAPLRPTPLFGLSFRPDTGVFYHGSPLVAFEVKFLREGHRQQALCTAIGQSVLYRAHRYPSVVTLLIDLWARTSEADVEHLEKTFDALRLRLLYLKKKRARLVPGRSAP